MVERRKRQFQSLQKNGTWIEVPITEAKTRILPGTWVFSRKRTPDGTIRKYKARYCERGNLQENVQETFAPVVAWSTVRLFLVLSLTLNGRPAQLTSAARSSKLLFRIQFGSTCRMDSTLQEATPRASSF
jgi:hypothetical protein